jgi:hypothetical protein
MSKLYKSSVIIFTIIALLYIFTIPNIFKPLSPYSAYDEGYKRGYGKYPSTCPSPLCKIHGKGFWKELITKE